MKGFTFYLVYESSLAKSAWRSSPAEVMAVETEASGADPDPRAGEPTRVSVIWKNGKPLWGAVDKSYLMAYCRRIAESDAARRLPDLIRFVEAYQLETQLY